MGDRTREDDTYVGRRCALSAAVVGAAAVVLWAASLVGLSGVVMCAPNSYAGLHQFAALLMLAFACWTAVDAAWFACAAWLLLARPESEGARGLAASLKAQWDVPGRSTTSEASEASEASERAAAEALSTPTLACGAVTVLTMLAAGAYAFSLGVRRDCAGQLLAAGRLALILDRRPAARGGAWSAFGGSGPVDKGDGKAASPASTSLPASPASTSLPTARMLTGARRRGPRWPVLAAALGVVAVSAAAISGDSWWEATGVPTARGEGFEDPTIPSEAATKARHSTYGRHARGKDAIAIGLMALVVLLNML